MPFAIILMLSALFVASVAAYFSVIGFASMFPALYYPAMLIACSLEVGKLVSSSFLYRRWGTFPNIWRNAWVSMVIVLMVFTSGSLFGMLSSGYQQDSIPLKEITSKIDLLKKEELSLDTRKKEIDKQISQLPENYVSARQKLMKTFAPELEHINKRLPEITQEIQTLTTKKITQESHVGPIIFIASALGKEVDDAIKWIVLLVISIFDPLAVSLVIMANMELVKYKQEKQAKLSKHNDIVQPSQSEKQVDISIFKETENIPQPLDNTTNVKVVITETQPESHIVADKPIVDDTIPLKTIKPEQFPTFNFEFTGPQNNIQETVNIAKPTPVSIPEPEPDVPVGINPESDVSIPTMFSSVNTNITEELNIIIDPMTIAPEVPADSLPLNVITEEIVVNVPPIETTPLISNVENEEDLTKEIVLDFSSMQTSLEELEPNPSISTIQQLQKLLIELRNNENLTNDEKEDKELLEAFLKKKNININ